MTSQYPRNVMNGNERSKKEGRRVANKIEVNRKVFLCNTAVGRKFCNGNGNKHQT